VELRFKNAIGKRQAAGVRGAEQGRGKKSES
jgi:hypothetical protein